MWTHQVYILSLYYLFSISTTKCKGCNYSLHYEGKQGAMHYLNVEGASEGFRVDSKCHGKFRGITDVMEYDGKGDRGNRTVGP